jgi:exopolysaccharide biosynthesis polyprenyl glycosylphosphotransferase
MTLVSDRGVDSSYEPEDRRGRTSRPRRSWASTEPVAPPRRDPDEVPARQVRWSRVAKRYMVTALLLDLFVAVAVATVVVLTLTPLDDEAMVAAGVTGVGFVITVALVRGYDRSSLGDGPAEYQSVLRGGILLSGAMMAAAYTTQVDVPRRLVFVAVPLAAVASCVVRWLQRRILHRRRKRGVATMRTLLVGSLERVTGLAAELARTPHHGYELVGVCTPAYDPRRQNAVDGMRVLGAFADVPQVAVDEDVDVVVVAGSALGGDALRRLSWALGRIKTELLVAPDLVEVRAPRLSLRPTATFSLLKVEVGASRGRVLGKAALDHVLGTLLAVAALPAVALAALAVRLTSPGPAFFTQTRVGVDGQPFTMWKLRSMYIDAEERLAALRERNDRDGPMFKMHSDPRVTPVGRILRKYSIDELPQLFNVVRGDMSLVGPRPPLAREVEKYHDEVYRRLHVRPGLTGLWQVSGRADLDWEESVRLDLRYVDNWSVAMDLMILWKTGRAVLGGHGAY